MLFTLRWNPNHQVPSAAVVVTPRATTACMGLWRIHCRSQGSRVDRRINGIYKGVMACGSFRTQRDIYGSQSNQDGSGCDDSSAYTFTAGSFGIQGHIVRILRFIADGNCVLFPKVIP